MNRIRLAVMLALAVVVAAGCAKESDAPREMGERMMEKALSQGGDKVKVELGDKHNVDMTNLPESLRYPGAEPIGHIVGAEANSETFILQTDASVSDVVAFFKNALSDYQPMGHNEGQQMVTLSYSTRDGMKQVGVVVGARNQTGKTSMNVTLTSK